MEPCGVDIISFWTGYHDQYHRPDDTAEKIDFDGYAMVVKIGTELIYANLNQ